MGWNRVNSTPIDQKSIGVHFVFALPKKYRGGIFMIRTIQKDGSILDLEENNEELNKIFWHTTSHILAQAVKRLYPNTKLGIGPAIENGFYYDFKVEKPLTEDDLNKIEEEMKKIVKEDLVLERSTLSREDAIKLMKENQYLLSLL